MLKKLVFRISGIFILLVSSSVSATAISVADSIFAVSLDGARFTSGFGNGDVLLTNNDSSLNDSFFSLPDSILVEDSALGFASAENTFNEGSNTVLAEANLVDDVFASSFQTLDLAFSVFSPGQVSVFVDYAISAAVSTDFVGESADAFASIEAVIQDSFLNDISERASDEVSASVVDGDLAFDDAFNSWEFSFANLDAGEYFLQVTSNALGISSVANQGAPAAVSSPQTLLLFALGLLALFVRHTKNNARVSA